MANAEYWRRRFESVETAAHKKADRTIRELDELFLDTQRTVQKEIESWYARYANSNGLSLSDAKKQLTAGELEEFKWDVKKYIEIGEKENLDKEWRKKLENASTRFHVSRLESVQITIQQQLERLYGNETDEIDKHLREVAGNGYTRTAYEIQKGIGIGWDITAVNETKLDALLAKPWTTDGKTFSDRLWSNQQQLVQSITKHLTQGLLRGDSHVKITEALKKDLGTTRYQAGRLVRTETTYMNAVAAKECYKDLGVDSVEIIATLDTHTCETCQPMDGKIIPRSQFEPGVTVPPFHPNCRCTTAPAIDEKYATERIARGADGKTYNVPANMTYEEWKKGFVDGEKKAIHALTAKEEKVEAGRNFIDVLDEYVDRATPGKGRVLLEEGYKEGRHAEEIQSAKLIRELLGGDIHLLNESQSLGEKMPDYKWRGRLWELKTITSTANATDAAVRKALKQIRENPGGVFLNYGDLNVDMENMVRVIEHRIKRGTLDGVDVIIINKNKIARIMRYKK